MKIRFVRPSPGLTVPRPTRPYAPMPTEWTRVEWPGPDAYYSRRAAAGDIDVCDELPVSPVVAAAKPSKKMED